MVLVVFAAHMFRGRPAVDTLLFSVALAVGLSPELLPAILSVNLARGAQMMARHGVLVRRLHAIENLGQHGRALHRQDRHADRRRGARSKAATTPTARAPSAVLELGRLERRARDRRRQPARRCDPRRREHPI